MISSTKTSFGLLFITILSCASAQTTFPCAEAFAECDFRFNNTRGLPTFWLGQKPDMSFTSRIVFKDSMKYLGVLNTNIIPQFIFRNRVVNITQFGSPRLTPSHFKPFFMNRTKGSGIGHQTFHGNQRTVSRGKCVRIYFSNYQLLSSKFGNVVSNMNNVMKNMNKCVVFRTRAIMN